MRIRAPSGRDSPARTGSSRRAISIASEAAVTALRSAESSHISARRSSAGGFQMTVYLILLEIFPDFIQGTATLRFTGSLDFFDRVRAAVGSQDQLPVVIVGQETPHDVARFVAYLHGLAQAVQFCPQ